MSYITSIGTANPPHKFSQQQIADFMIRAMELNEEEAQQLRILYRASGIENRYSVLEDYGTTEQFSFYSNSKNLEPFPSTKSRLELYRKQSVNISKNAALKCLNAQNTNPKNITHLIAVSCTGMYAPGLDIDLIEHLQLNSTIQRTCINFMGCYAAFNALKVADSLCAQNPAAIVLIVCTELCSIHFQKENTEDNKVANAFFADGSAALLIQSRAGKGASLKIGSFFCDLAPDGNKDMAWSVGNQGFEMKLSSYVPNVIKKGISKLTSSLLQANKININDISYFAVHPGGKKILETIEQELGIDRRDNQFSYSVLKKYGNMSSPTVLFVLKEIYDQLSSNDHNKKILSFGFGPGLTLESLVLTVQST